MTKIDIMSGFLGAGKTTLIKKLLKEALADTKVVLIENEFGEIGIDGGFLKEAGIEFQAGNMWYEESNVFQLVYLGIICLLFVVLGIILDRRSFIEGIKLSKESGRAASDYVLKKGAGPTLVNMGLTGILTIIFLIIGIVIHITSKSRQR